MATEKYVRAVLEWQSKMDAELRAEDGWLSLVGLFWLKKGLNTLGSSPDCDIRLPKQAPWLLGAIKLDGADATLQPDVGQTAEVNGVPVKTATTLRSDDEEQASIITLKTLRMVIVRQAGRVGLRLWDNQLARELPPRNWFEVDERFCVKALYQAYPVPVKVEMPNVLGEMEIGYVQGYLSFKLDGKSYHLNATELDDGRLYLQFSDLTNGAQTYPAGRYLYTECLLEDGRVVVDFNKAYNPPCAFRELAPCTFATSGNRLKVAIEAGELYNPRGGYEKGTLTF